MKNQIKTIAFDADDTLWENEPYFREAELEFAQLFGHLPLDDVIKDLFDIEMKNLKMYGYGIKGFMLCMVEAAAKLSGDKIESSLINQLFDIGHRLLQKPIVLLDGIEETLQHLHGKYRLVMATKGDLLDQERKLEKSGLAKYFHHIEIMSDKQPRHYQKLINHLDCKPENFLMVGNSRRSDIVPVLALNAFAIEVPYHTTWIHELHEEPIEHPNFVSVTSIDQIIGLL
ncbi:HAD family hydrolase [Pedobacter xixiisoli]|uniref:Putative hydrolase of the HAD superfamily n=1 Tax=Pedobacter xixiisoli TaxID=1476464 RepID=A0A285ZYG3_9SPHI|nr:HAD family hydrolase [Pedobacter xixiisoli]SOD14683.1 putative hydrolase of the HAD superfamily [Pedobacter xixiisoli]